VNRSKVADIKEFEKGLSVSAETGRVLLHVRDNRGSRFVVLEME
jgi:hypothetical protein